jgi:hypothetical protein
MLAFNSHRDRAAFKRVVFLPTSVTSKAANPPQYMPGITLAFSMRVLACRIRSTMLDNTLPALNFMIAVLVDTNASIPIQCLIPAQIANQRAWLSGEP